MTDIAKIARGLTKAQRIAIHELPVWKAVQTPVHEFAGYFWGTHPATLNALLAKGIVCGRENYSSRTAGITPRAVGLTPLGLQAWDAIRGQR